MRRDARKREGRCGAQITTRFIHSPTALHAWDSDSVSVLQTFYAKPVILERALLNDLKLFSDYELLEMFPPSHLVSDAFNPPIFAIRLDPPSDCHIVCRLFLSLS